MEFKIVEGGYSVSACGKIFGKFGKELRTFDNGKGYQILQIRIMGKSVTKMVHRLVAEAWIPNPNNLPEVNHINSIRSDNRVENLEWCSRSENISHSYQKGAKTVAGTSNPRCKTTEEIVHEICRLLQAGKRAAEIRDMGYDYNLCRKIASRQNWRNIAENYTF